jgi:subtilisin family serine protease
MNLTKSVKTAAYITLALMVVCLVSVVKTRQATAASASLMQGLPNLTPFQPLGWADKTVVSTITGTNTNSTPLKTTDTLYIDFAVINNGNAAIGVTFFTKLFVDGVERGSFFSEPPMNANTYAFVQDYSIGSLSAGNHTIKIVTDTTGAVAESSELDNEYTKTITVTAPISCFTLTTNTNSSVGGTVTRNTAPNCPSSLSGVAAEQASPDWQEPGAIRADIASLSGDSRSAATVKAFKTLLAEASAKGTVRVIVGLKVAYQPEAKLPDTATVQAQRSAITQLQESVLSRLSNYDPDSVKKFYFIPAMALEVDAANLKQLEASAEIATIEEDLIVPLALAESVARIGAPAAWASGFSGAGQTVAILDSGVDKTHPFLAGKVVSEACYSANLCPGGAKSSTSPGSGVNCNSGFNGCDHGTHVAGIVAGKGTSFSGVAKDANIIAIQVFSATNEGNIGASDSDMISGLQRVHTLSSSFNIASVNISIGGGFYSSTCDFEYPKMKEAIDALSQRGIATVIASGNEAYTNGISFPACISTAVSVGSTDDGGPGTTADAISIFNTTQASNSSSFLRLLAPGQPIVSSVPNGEFKTKSGTSMATPHVAGAWAVLKSKSPTATVTQVLSALTSTGVPVTDGRNGITKPRIKVDAALNALGGGGSGQYSSGTVTTLTAVPNTGYAFQSWSGCDSVSGSTCTVTMNANRTVTANFAQLVIRTLTVASVNPASSASITVSPSDNNGLGGGITQLTRSYNNNTVVSLTASAIAGGNNFQKWQRDGLDFSTNSTISVTMDANHTLTAVYSSPVGGCRATPITVGQTVNGTLSITDCLLLDGSFYDPYTFSGTAGQQVAVAASSTNFDTYLALLKPGETPSLSTLQDDDGGGGTNSRIPAGSGFITLPVSGTYTIFANSYGAGVIGPYALTLTGPNAAASVQFSAANYNANEGSMSANITVTRTGNTAGTVSVRYMTVDNPAAVRCDTAGGIAFARCDYATSIDTLTFAAGETSKTFAVPLLDDAHVEGNETLTLRLSGPTGATLGAQSTATLTITDNDTVAGVNPIFNSPFFVRQHYLDFLSREPDTAGYNAWLGVLNGCSNVNNNPACDRITVSASFFGSQEFKLKGYFVYRFYKLAFNRLPAYDEIVPDMSAVTGQTAQEVFAKKAAFANSFVQRTEFSNAYGALSNTQYVTTLMNRYFLTQITAPDPVNPDGTGKVILTSADLTSRLNNGTLTRAQVLRALADSDQVFNVEFNSAFVAMQYYGYLRRTPEAAGYQAWLNYLNAHPTDSRTMVNGFMNSTEYRLRFGQP